MCLEGAPAGANITLILKAKTETFEKDSLLSDL